MIKIQLNNILKASELASFETDGDVYERKYYPLVNVIFPNCQVFWKRFVILMTNRICENMTPEQRIRPREGISLDILDISMLNYSVFMKLIYADNHFPSVVISSFEDFYSNLVSSCDLAEEFLLKCYLLFGECYNKRSEVLTRLSRENFLMLAGNWYDNNYSELYENYYIKGKSNPIRIPSRKNILDEYYDGYSSWREYKTFTQALRTFRNVIVHETQMGSIQIGRRELLVPRKEKIKKYKRITDVFAALCDGKLIETDFIIKDAQMRSDIDDLKRLLNMIWDKPLNDFVKLFYEEKNKILLKKFNLELV